MSTSFAAGQALYLVVCRMFGFTETHGCVSYPRRLEFICTEGGYGRV